MILLWLIKSPCNICFFLLEKFKKKREKQCAFRIDTGHPLDNIEFPGFMDPQFTYLSTPISTPHINHRFLFLYTGTLTHTYTHTHKLQSHLVLCFTTIWSNKNVWNIFDNYCLCYRVLFLIINASFKGSTIEVSQLITKNIKQIFITDVKSINIPLCMSEK